MVQSGKQGSSRPSWGAQSLELHSLKPLNILEGEKGIPSLCCLALACLSLLSRMVMRQQWVPGQSVLGLTVVGAVLTKKKSQVRWRSPCQVEGVWLLTPKGKCWLLVPPVVPTPGWFPGDPPPPFLGCMHCGTDPQHAASRWTGSGF